MFHNNFIKFLKKLKGVLPESSDIIRQGIEYYKSQTRSDFIQETKLLLDPHMQYISENDSGIFTDDYQQGPRYLLPKMNFRDIWKLIDETEDFKDDEDLQETTRVSIFKHLQAIYISCNMALNQIGLFDKNMEKQKKFLMDMLDNLKVDEEVRAKIEQLKQDEKDSKNKGNNGFGLDQLTSLLGGDEDNFVLQLARDIAQEIDLGNDDIDNPVDAITSLFADGGKKIQELIVTVGEKLEQKIKSGEVDKERLYKDAAMMKEKFSGLTDKIPGVKDLMSNDVIMEQYRQGYNNLSHQQQQEYKDVLPLLDKKPDDWNDNEKELFNNFAQFIIQQSNHVEPEESIDDINTSSKPKVKTSTRKHRVKKVKGRK